MPEYMDDTGGTKRIEYDKIALLGLFILALLTAYFLVIFKSRVSFSDPIPLSKMGLAVSIPVGQSWQSDIKWRYQDNKFSLSSIFPRGSDRPTTWINCRYLLSADTTPPQIRFEQRASDIEAIVTETNRTQIDTLTIYWARISKAELYLSMFFGTARLPDNRQLDIEVARIAGGGGKAEQIFKHIIETLKFEDNNLLEAGSEIVTKIKSKGIDGFLNKQNRQAYFLVKDAEKNTIGFTMDVLVETDAEAQPDIRAAGRFYLRGINSIEQATSFECSNDLDEFVYKSEISRRAGRSGTETILDGQGVITIRKLQAEPEEKTYRLGPAAIPDVFLDHLLLQMLERSRSQMIVDIIESGGKIVPAFIAAIEMSEEDLNGAEDAAFAFMLEPLDGRGFSEKIFLNDSKQIFLRLVRQKDVYILEQAELENIVNEFPEYAEHISHYRQMLR